MALRPKGIRWHCCRNIEDQSITIKLINANFLMKAVRTTCSVKMLKPLLNNLFPNYFTILLRCLYKLYSFIFFTFPPEMNLWCKRSQQNFKRVFKVTSTFFLTSKVLLHASTEDIEIEHHSKKFLLIFAVVCRTLKKAFALSFVIETLQQYAAHQFRALCQV